MPTTNIGTLSEPQLNTLSALARADSPLTQWALSRATGTSLERVNTATRECEVVGYTDERVIINVRREALEPYCVTGAVIMAAGPSSRFAPISYERSKGTPKARGEILVERQIRQLHGAGITNIALVVGYKKEYFFYPADKYGVDIAVNRGYSTCNNSGSFWLMKDRLDNTYVCSSDDYFTTNPFEPYVYKAYYSANYVEGPTDEWRIKTGPGNRIMGATAGGTDAWVMFDHVYPDHVFSAKFREILEQVYHLSETVSKLWESIYPDYIKSFGMVIRRYPDGTIHEFDSVDELRTFDPLFMGNVDPEALDHIVVILGCQKSDICDFYPFKRGITNLSCHLTVGDGEHIYRHSGIGTEKIMDRSAGLAGLHLVAELGIDNTFLTDDPAAGWKISRFVRNARNLDVTRPEELRSAMEMGRALYTSGRVLNHSFDFVTGGLRYEGLLKAFGPTDVPGYFELRNKALRLRAFADADGFDKVSSHSDLFPPNFLVDEDGKINLIDWEHAGMSDMAADFDTIVVCTPGMTHGCVVAVLEYYLGHDPSEREARHFFAYEAFAGWCWYLWAPVKEAEGDDAGEWLHIYYSHAIRAFDSLLVAYEAVSSTQISTEDELA